MFLRGKASKLETNHSNSRTFGKMIGRTALVTALAAALTVNTVYAAGSIETVYHVYLDGEKLGTVNEEAVVEEVIETKAEELEADYPDYELSAGNQLKIVPEKVFRAQYNNEQVEEQLSEQLEVKAAAFALTIGDDLVGYVEDEQAAKETLRQLKLQFVTEAELTAFENAKTNSEAEVILKDIRFSAEPNLSAGYAVPADILTVEEMVKKLRTGQAVEQPHVVKEGEVLVNIAKEYGLSMKQLYALNPDVTEETLIHIDDEINVTVDKPFVNVIVEKEKRATETIKAAVEVIQDKTMYKGDTKVKQEGKDGEKEVHYRLIEENGKTVKKEVLKETVTKEKQDKIVIKGTKVVPSRGTGQFAWPTVGGTVTSHYGYRWGRQHKGIDIAGVSNRTIKAADNGKVVKAGWGNGYGKQVIIDHNNGFRTTYSHLSSISVSVGQTVSRGTKIGMMGSTGNSTGVHLHFEIYKNGAVQNPMKYY